MSTLTVDVSGIGASGPGFADWPALRAILLGVVAYQPQRTQLPLPAALPPAEQRRVGPAIRLALAVGSEAVAMGNAEVATLSSVFAAAGGDGGNCDALCRALSTAAPQLSPTRFHNSVQNAPAGYWGIAQRAVAPSISIGGFDDSFAVGLLEAVVQVVTQHRPVLLVASDTDYPEPLRATRPIPDALGVALLLVPSRSARALASLRVGLRAGVAERMEQAALEPLRTAIPAARALPLLQQIARAQSGTVRVQYSAAQILQVEVDAAA